MVKLWIKEILKIGFETGKKAIKIWTHRLSTTLKNYSYLKFDITDKFKDEMK